MARLNPRRHEDDVLEYALRVRSPLPGRWSVLWERPPIHTLVALPAAQCLHALPPTLRTPSQDITVKTYSRRNDSPKIESPVMSWAPYPIRPARSQPGQTGIPYTISGSVPNGHIFLLPVIGGRRNWHLSLRVGLWGHTHRLTCNGVQHPTIGGALAVTIGRLFFK